jgi:hypothetical protein
MLIVLAIAAAGMVRVLTQHWREGAVLLGGSLEDCEGLGLEMSLLRLSPVKLASPDPIMPR